MVYHGKPVLVYHGIPWYTMVHHGIPVVYHDITMVVFFAGRSGDIRDQSRRLYKIDRNFACFWPPDFWGEGPPNFWSWIIKLRQFPITWPSFTAIGRGTSENAWRKNK